MIDISFQNKRAPKNGYVLISDPFLDEDYFRGSVILLCEHNENGTFGFVLNHYLEVDLHSLDETFPDVHARISVGGPVDTQSLYFIHTMSDLSNSMAITDRLYFGGDYETLQQILKDHPERAGEVRFFIGYSGWEKDQLDKELTENSWIVANNITAEEILNTSNDDLWKYCLEKQGERYKTISKFPLNPNDN